MRMFEGRSSRVFCARFSSICSVSPEILSERMICSPSPPPPRRNHDGTSVGRGRLLC